jgi:hypothetical protein
MSELNKQEIQSPEMQEVMTEIPGSFLKWGLLIFFAIILILLLGSYFIKSPETVTVPVVLTTHNPPVILIARTGGEIEKLYISEGSEVKKNEVIAIVRNTASYDDVIELDKFLAGFDNKSDWVTIVKTMEPPPELLLGEVQVEYARFQKGWKQMEEYLNQAYLPNKLNLLEKQIEIKRGYYIEVDRQKILLTEDLELAKNSFYRDSALYYKDSNSISKTQYEKSRQSYIQKLYSHSVFNASLKNNESEFLRLKETRLDLRVQHEKELKQFILTMEESLQLLRSSIDQWEERYLIKTPISGKITLTLFRSENQVIKAGEILATVLPDSISGVVVRGVIPVSGFGKVEVGQSVNIKLSGFPYMQYGVLKGRIYSLSQVPGEGGFSAEIELSGGMTSTYKEKIRFIHQMDGTADIITKETRLFNKFFNPLRSALKN